MDGFSIVLVIVILAGAGYMLFRNRKKQGKALDETATTTIGSDLSTAKDLFDADTTHLAPVSSFHVHGVEARVTFDVPLGDEDDPILNDLLVEQGIEVVREKNRELPIDMVEEIVVFAGRENEREVGRHRLPETGQLPPPSPSAALSFANIAHDPFDAPFSGDDTAIVDYDVTSETPQDDLPPMIEELQIPMGLDRGLRATGVDPSKLDGPELVLALLRMFGYRVTEQADPGSYLAMKDGVTSYIFTVAHQPGEHPELDEPVIRHFLANYSSSGAERGILVTDKYSPFMIHEIETHQPKVKFITRERVQNFVDSMAMG